MAPIPPLSECAFLLDIDGTLVDLAPRPEAVNVPQRLKDTLVALLRRTDGALALVSGRTLHDIDQIFEPLRFPAVGGHGAELRTSGHAVGAAADVRIERELKKRFSAIADLGRGIILEDKGYSLAIHYRLAPVFEDQIYKAIAAIRADLPAAPIEVLAGKRVVEIKPKGFSKATAVRQLMTHSPFKGRHPIFVGDDVTDDTVFAIMPDLLGTAYSVGRRVVGLNGYFTAPADVRTWLAGLVEAGEAGHETKSHRDTSRCPGGAG